MFWRQGVEAQVSVLVVKFANLPMGRDTAGVCIPQLGAPNGDRQVQVVGHVTLAHGQQRQARLWARLHTADDFQCGFEGFAQVQPLAHTLQHFAVLHVVVSEITTRAQDAACGVLQVRFEVLGYQIKDGGATRGQQDFIVFKQFFRFAFNGQLL